ncbi:MAG: glutathione S-transferase N-terminal domain-containing protein [Pseudomonadota bacterium]|nr:glutathione S-transferase N-terminal domain-containing protein [Pseudomonadota bacterium]
MAVLSGRRSVMTLYCEAKDPIGHCARIVLAEKDVSVDINYVGLDNRPEDLNELNPYGTVLTLIDRDLVLYDAQIMMEYLDERFPHPPLLPVDPVARANNRQFRYRVFRDLYHWIDSVTGKNEIAASNARKALRDNLTVIAPSFVQRQYFMSADYSLVDCSIAPLLWRLHYYGIKLPNQAKPLLKYAERLFARSSFKFSLSEFEKDMREHP